MFKQRVAAVVVVVVVEAVLGSNLPQLGREETGFLDVLTRWRREPGTRA